jgi:hypothetical protein
MKKTTFIAAAALGLASVANAGVIYSATTGNSTLLDSGYNSTGSATLTGTEGNLVVYNNNGGFNSAGIASTENINTLNGTALTADDTVILKVTVDSISGDLRSQGVIFGMFSSNSVPNADTGLIIGTEMGNIGNDINIRSSFQDIGATGDKSSNAEIYNGFSITLTANVDGYSFVLDSIGDTTPITVNGTFSGTEFVDNFGTGHFNYSAQKFNTGAVTTTISEATITVIPEPATLGLVVAMGGSLLWVRRVFMV